MREPTIFWHPGTIRPGVVTELGSTLDLLPTFARMVDEPLPADRPLDGYDLTPILHTTGAGGKSPRQTMFYWRGSKLFAVRHGSFKAHFITKSEYGADQPVEHDPPLLYNLDEDAAEKYNIAAGHPGVIAQIRQIATAHRASITAVENQLDKR